MISRHIKRKILSLVGWGSTPPIGEIAGIAEIGEVEPHPTKRWLLMKIESVSIQHFKLFENFQLSFKNKTLQEVSERFLIIGDNGTGKTSLLQAIALPLALVTRTRFIVQSLWQSDDRQRAFNINIIQSAKHNEKVTRNACERQFPRHR
jgi:hypothetical protein